MRPRDIAFALIVTGVMLALTWPHAFIGSFSDSVSYLRMATVLSPFASPDSAALESFRTTHFPPGYPWLLGMLGAATDRLLWTSIVHGALFALAMIVTARFFRDELGDRRQAQLVTLIVVLSPVWLIAGLRPCSEPLFTILLLAGLMLARRGDLRSAALLLGLSCLVRTAGLAFLPGLAMWLIRRRVGWRRGIAIMAWAGLPYVLWQLWCALHPSHSGLTYTSDLSLTLQAFADGRGWAFVRQQGSALLSALSLALQPVPISILVGLMVAIGVVPGWFRRLRENRLDASLLPFYLAMIALWPYPDEIPRFVGPVIPLLALGICAGLRAPVRGLGLGVAVLCLWTLSQTAGVIWRLAYPVAAPLAPYKVSDPYYTAADQTAALMLLEAVKSFDQAARSVPMAVPEGRCVYSVIPELAGFLAHRPFVSPRPGLTAPAADWGDFPECEFFLVSLLSPAQGFFPSYYPLAVVQAMAQQIFFIPIKQGDQTVLSAALLAKQPSPAAP